MIVCGTSPAWRPWPPGGGGVPARAVIWRHPRRRRRRYRSRAGPGCRGPGLPDRGSRVRMRRCLLHVPQRDPSIQGGGDEGVSQRVGCDGLADPGAAGGLADDPPGAVPVQPPPVRGQEHRPSVRSPMARSIVRAVRGASGMVTTLPPLRVIVSVRCPRSRPRCSMSAPVAAIRQAVAVSSDDRGVMAVYGSARGAARLVCGAAGHVVARLRVPGVAPFEDRARRRRDCRRESAVTMRLT